MGYDVIIRFAGSPLISIYVYSFPATTRFEMKTSLSLQLLGLCAALLPASAVPVAELSGQGPDCTAKSQNVTHMLLKSWDVWHAPSVNAHLKSTFLIFNPGPEEDYSIKDMPFIEDGEWHDCGPVSAKLVACQYMNDVDIGGVGFHLSWACGDAASKHR